MRRKPYNTLFVARLSYDTNEKKLRREFEQYGPIKSIRVVHDLEVRTHVRIATSSSSSDIAISRSLCVLPILVCSEQGNPRGYAFVEFENEDDMKTVNALLNSCCHALRLMC